ncbi:hypothetical protein K2D_35760 [Planctomycetes bacterium K2D]|uniref:Uncharacterized protein n=1 Tax=Botrimarina mediterranea TaxID=2528022 RepID=A0A518KBV1_9BACT|nr:hypothetical protein Spa11_35010 [Botrimarina mediterranea]QDV79956.1 hypothetical protein K2D_35760 [Planctomycetes bacterium K2D]
MMGFREGLGAEGLGAEGEKRRCLLVSLNRLPPQSLAPHPRKFPFDADPLVA